MEETRVPVFPPEIISNILKLSYVREDGKPLFLRPKDSSDPAYFTNMSIDAMRSRPRAYNPNSNQQPPRTKHSAPAINLLLVSKSFRKEGYAQFYRENTFSFSDGDHSDEILENLDLSKRQHIHRISFESQWELKIDLYPDMSGDIEFEFAMDWGNFETKALRRLPNIETIELRVRCTARHGVFIKRFHAFTWRANTGEKILIGHKRQMVEYLEVKHLMESHAAKEVGAEYRALGMERFLPMVKVAFLYSESKEWKGDERMLALADINRDRTQFGRDSMKC